MSPVVGGVLGPLSHPDVVIAGLYTDEGELVVVGRIMPLKPDQSAQLATVLIPAASGHPWPDEITSYRWGGPDSKEPLTKVEPVVVAEVAADAATQAGQARPGTGCTTSATAQTCDRTTSRLCRTAPTDRLHGQRGCLL
jgi:hypothetical protein